jgi:hypothetical protein
MSNLPGSRSSAMANLSDNPLCTGCRQDLLRDCPATLGVNDARPCIVATLRKFVQAGSQAGISTETLIEILRAGVPIATVLDLIQSRLNARRAEPRYEQP